MNDDMTLISLKAHSSLLRLFDALSKHDVDMHETHVYWLHFQLYRSVLQKLGVPRLCGGDANIEGRFDEVFLVTALENRSVQGFLKVVEQHSDFVINTTWQDFSELEQHLARLNCLIPDQDDF